MQEVLNALVTEGRLHDFTRPEQDWPTFFKLFYKKFNLMYERMSHMDVEADKQQNKFDL